MNTQKAISRSRSAAAPRSTMWPRASARRAASESSRVLPIPAAPTTSMALGRPVASTSRASSMRRSSSRRPTRLSAIVKMSPRTISGSCPDVEAREHEEGGDMPSLHAKHATQHGHPQPEEATGRAGAMRRMKQLLLVLCAAQLMVILDITAVNVALPDLAHVLDIADGDIGWTITSYSLIFGSLLL